MDVARHESILIKTDDAAKISDRGHPLFFLFRQNSSGAGTLIPA